jgi:hypothetical protein
MISISKHRAAFSRAQQNYNQEENNETAHAVHRVLFFPTGNVMALTFY